MMGARAPKREGIAPRNRRGDPRPTRPPACYASAAVKVAVTVSVSPLSAAFDEAKSPTL